jgi:hypothetical protein
VTDTDTDTNTDTNTDVNTNTDTGTTGDTSTDAAAAFVPVFGPDDSLQEILTKAYQGEVLGEALFRGIAELLPDEDHAAKMLLLSELERRTKEAAAPALVRAGVDTEPDPEVLTTAAALVPDAAAMGWEELMVSFEPITSQYIPLYQRVGELNPAEREISDLLVAHERALCAFARAELAGQTSTSLEPIQALAHMR